MSARDRGKDRRPRILDFSTPIGDARIGRDLAWPCHAFRVTVPVRAEQRLNAFEEAILRLLEDARRNEHALAEATCLEESLVKLVCSRLRDLGMLTERNELARPARTYLSGADEEATDYEVRVVFRERISGALLPMVLGGELRYEDLAGWSIQDRFAEIRRNDHTTTPVRLLLEEEPARLPAPPTPVEVLRATRQHQALSRQYSVLRRGVPPCPAVAHADRLDVDPNPESVHLRCRVVIPTGGDDLRIGDPFGYGFSETLFRAYEDLRERDPKERDFVRKLRDTPVRPRSPRGERGDAEAERAVLSRLAAGVAGYPELFAKLRHAERELGDPRHPTKSSGQEAHLAYHGQQAVQSLSEALETALGLVVARSRPAASEVMLSGGGQNHRENGQLLEELAERVGLRAAGSGGLLDVPAGRIRALRAGSVDLQALLAVAIAAAAEDKEHPLRRLARSFGDWLRFLRDLKAIRDAVAHGQSRAAGPEQLEELREGAYRSIELLLPALVRQDQAPRPAETEAALERVHEARRRAISSLEGHFGVRWYSAVGTGEAEVLVQLEIAADSLRKTAEKEIDAARVINDLASVLQALSHPRRPGATPALDRREPPRESAARRAIEAGLLRQGASLPACLASVNPKRLDDALRGESPSLGASLMALLLLARTEELRQIAELYPDFLPLCARVIELRGHGNRPVHLPPGEVLVLKERVYDGCRALVEALG